MKKGWKKRAVIKDDSGQETNPSSVRPVLFLGVCFLSFILIICLPDSVFAPLNHSVAYLSGQCIGLFGRHATVTGDIISLDGFMVRIIPECTALYCMVLFAAFVISVPASLKSRLVGLLLGVSVLGKANILRIALVTIVGAGYPCLFEGVHVYMGQVVMLLLTITVSLLWKRWATCDSDSDGSFLLRATAMTSLIFPLWLVTNSAYVRCLDYLVAGLFSVADYRLVFTSQHFVYYQTFNVVLFIALMLAEKRIQTRRKVKWIACGLGIMVAGHLLFRVGNVMLTAFDWQPALQLTDGLMVFCDYLLPFVLWTTVSGRWLKNDIRFTHAGSNEARILHEP